MSGTSLRAFSQSNLAAEGFFHDNQNQEPRVSIAIIDARGLMRDSLVRYMTSERDFSVVGYSSVDELLASDTSQSHSLVIFGSASHANQSALDEIARLKTEYPTCLMLAIVETNDQGAVRRLLQCGVRGIVPTTFPASFILQVISFVLLGGSYVPAESLLQVNTNASQQVKAAGANLTNREQQIIALLRGGQQNKQIAYELGLSIGTVKVHLHNIMKKLGTHNRVQALAQFSLTSGEVKFS
jgi:DNA-binding NarL/FixJ family response regulator